jgi:Nickel-containing superoxide dismutase
MRPLARLLEPRTVAHAHCDLPYGVYDPAQARIEPSPSRSWLVQDGAPLYDIQALLGHESFQTTERYAHLAPGAATACSSREPGGQRKTLAHMSRTATINKAEKTKSALAGRTGFEPVTSSVSQYRRRTSGG